MLTYNSHVTINIKCTQTIQLSQSAMENPLFTQLAYVYVFVALCLSCTDLGLLVSYFWCCVAQDMMHLEDYRKRKRQLKQEVSVPCRKS
jgi:hypothetical protein